ncbi:hypothetical protein [Catellatospora paridis]|uniref:hypothetical protein n=1 Tax=Catellatospora paridis TaxID=1617086 RepID=UPI0012D4AD85|nr:hypothetical protein [Catellatospora paridis]
MRSSPLDDVRDLATAPSNRSILDRAHLIARGIPAGRDGHQQQERQRAQRPCEAAGLPATTRWYESGSSSSLRCPGRTGRRCWFTCGGSRTGSAASRLLAATTLSQSINAGGLVS